ncbi:ABC transporter permease subunit [Salipaludibacillus aurantiacus]|uniref:ABC-2 type transport system permease protein n=1 Tax=Salipaludibacillus aurantiacus TaxID=1601833 RepID=A0A1H9RQJ2_9BACI|nr:ABC transporter permease subunit [Salipaludibacillus aurantiacus]SER75080.1 ABC-2 type transport system permease protein [Salipaludibacillus aurantiacus]
MFHKALWYQNYKQTRMIIWIILALFIIHMPFQSVLSLETWKEREEQANQAEGYVYEVQKWDVLQIFSQGTLPVFLSFSIIALACLLIGLERNTRRNDFTFSLPFSRKDLFLAKWLYGVSAIFFFHIINFFTAFFIIYQSDYSTALYLVSWIEIFWGPLLGFIMFFTFALLIGTFTGEMISQVGLTFLLGFLPQGVFALIQSFTEVHFRYIFSLPDWINYLTPFNYVFNQSGEILSVVLPLIFTGLFLWLSTYLYEKNKIEHNGEFLIFKVLNPVFLTGITISISLAGGMIVSALAPWSADALRIIAYWIGFTTFLLFALLIGRRIVTMNIQFYGKP